MKRITDKAIYQTLKTVFGFDSFKGDQQKIIKTLLKGKDCFVIMPTGGGKSLCYQLPAMILDGIAIVVSPLIALMKNQVDAVRYTSGAPASAIANGSAMISSGKDTWGNPGSVTFIGKRASDAAAFSGSIYCIRLYSRQLTDAEIAANQAIDQIRFIDHLGPDTLKVTTSAEGMSSPSPACGYVNGLAAGETVSVSCGNATVTNANGSVYSCTGWKTFREDGTQVSSGPETSFTYTHPSPAEYRELQWQWEMTGSPTNYVSDGLIACWDGIENAAPGVHVDGTDVWKDIVGGREFNLTDATAGDNCMNFLGTTTSYGTLSATDTASTFLAAKSGTLEIAYRSTSGAGNQVLLQSTAASGLAFGIYGTTQIIPVHSPPS